MLDASYQAYKSVEIAGFVGWIRPRSRRIRQSCQLPDATLDASYQAYNPVENAGFVRHIRHINHDVESVVQSAHVASPAATLPLPALLIVPTLTGADGGYPPSNPDQFSLFN